MEQTFNKLLPVTTFDVADMDRNWMVIYLPEKKQVMILRTARIADKVISRLNENAIALTKSQAPKAYPEVFFNSKKKKMDQKERTIVLKVSPEQYAFCHRSKNISDYLRKLIDEQMKKQ